MISLYEQIKAAGIPFSNHESDLYFQANPESRRILAQFPSEESNSTSFLNQAPPHKGEQWIDVPFAFLPWWETRQKRQTATA